jgi:hypothetical protein
VFPVEAEAEVEGAVAGLCICLTVAGFLAAEAAHFHEVAADEAGFLEELAKSGVDLAVSEGRAVLGSIRHLLCLIYYTYIRMSSKNSP